VVYFRDFLVIAESINARRPLSFHAVSFGPNAAPSSLRKMAQIALDVQNNAPQDPLHPPTASVPSSYTAALDTVRSTSFPPFQTSEG
jgi:hypothetical protein